MLFNSLSFLVFFPLVTLAYYLIPQRGRYLWLLAASYFFYMCWNAQYALLLATSTLITYASGLLIAAAKKRPLARFWVALSLASNLGILFFFKYFAFAAASVQQLFAWAGWQLNVPQFDILLPVGISFYTFQALSYTMDVYAGRVGPERNLLKYALFVSFYPQLVAGPIERSSNLLHQIGEEHPLCWQNVKSGLLRMLWGFFEKLLIADQAAVFVDAVYQNYQTAPGVQIAVATVLFAFQIYCDFDGYSNIAIGAARVMGFTLMDNFRQPYFAASVKEFWHRWHISLSTWFRDYLYFPLGGSRCGRVRAAVNVLVVFTVSGLWHGAAWHYVIWGALNGLFQVVGGWTLPLRRRLGAKLPFGLQNRLWRAVRCLVTFVLVDFAWLFFRADSLGAARQLIGRMTSDWQLSALWDGSLRSFGLNGWQLVVLAACLLVLLAVDLLHESGRSVQGLLARGPVAVRWSCYLTACAVLAVFAMASFGGDASNFIYFQF